MRRALLSSRQFLLSAQARSKHESLLPTGAGGRSSFSGQAATVFGATGNIGHTLVNNLGRTGSSVVIPHRSSTEAYRVTDLRIMGDLGAFNFVQMFDMERWNDTEIAALIQHSNIVYNVIGSNRELNTWPRRHVNVEWPERLAKMVADKGDDTRLIHLVHLNAGNEELAEHSAILREQGEAIERMREIYPATIIVKAATAVGYNDQFTHWWATEGEMRHRSLQYIGAFPLMYGGGQNTYVSPVVRRDIGRALVKIGAHPDSDGHDFELFGEKTYKLAEIVEFMYDIKWQTMRNMLHHDKRSASGMWYHRMDVDLDFFCWDVLGEMKMDPKDMTMSQRIRRKALRFHLAKLHWPRFNLGGVRALDFVHRYKSHYSDWTNEDHFNLMNMSHVPTFQNPGFADLGMTLNCPLQSIHESCTNYMPGSNIGGIGSADTFKRIDDFDLPPSHEWKPEDVQKLAHA